MTDATIIKLSAQEKETDKNPRQLRASGFIPATIYGKGMESKNIQLNTHEFELASRNNRDAKYEICLGKEKFNVVIQELQMNYATNTTLNVEFKTV